MTDRPSSNSFWRTYALELVAVMIVGSYIFAAGAYAYGLALNNKTVKVHEFESAVAQIDRRLATIEEDVKHLIRLQMKQSHP